MGSGTAVFSGKHRNPKSEERDRTKDIFPLTQALLEVGPAHPLTSHPPGLVHKENIWLSL